MPDFPLTNQVPGNNMSVLDFPGFNATTPPQGAASTPVPQGKPGVPDFLTELSSTPEGKVAMLQMIGGLLQPTGFGKSGAGIMGQALNDAATGFIKSKDMRLGREQEQQKIDEDIRKDVESNPTEASKKALNDALISYYGRLPEARSAGSKKVWQDENIIQAAMRDKNMDRDQAVIYLYEFDKSGGKSDPDTQALIAQGDATKNLAYDPAGLQQLVTGIKETGGRGNRDTLSQATPAHFSYLLTNPTALGNAVRMYGAGALLERAPDEQMIELRNAINALQTGQ